MNQVYNYTYEADGIRRLNLCVVNGISNRYLWHTPIELMIVLGGEIEYFASGQRYLIKKDDMLFFNEDCGHFVSINSTDTYALSVQLHPEVLKELGIYFSRDRDCVFVTKEQLCTREQLLLLQQTSTWLVQALFGGAPEDRKHAELLAASLFYTVLRIAGLLRRQPVDIKGMECRNDRIEMIKHYISDNYSKHISLQEIADVAGHNKSYLCALFRHQTGFSIMDYINRVRIQAAIDMIEKDDGNVSLTEIALLSGFSTYSSFQSHVLRCCGKRPQEYKAGILHSKISGQYRHFVSVSDEYVNSRLLDYRKGTDRMEPPSGRDPLFEKIEDHSRAILDLLHSATE